MKEGTNQRSAAKLAATIGCAGCILLLSWSVVSVAGQRPVAKIAGQGDVAVGAQVMLDASESSSAEGRALSYAWRLTTRPRDSAATLTELQAVTSSFTADTAGLFEVELVVFDGELWSEPPALLLMYAQ